MGFLFFPCSSWPFAEEVKRFDFEVEKDEDVAFLELPTLAPSLG